MQNAIATLLGARKMFLEVVSSLSLEQLNQIPTGFNNNIVWNMGHVVAAQQGLCYTRANAEKHIDDEFFNTYKSGSKPERFITQAEVDHIKTIFTTHIEQLEVDYNKQLLANYNAYQNRFGVQINTIDDAIHFVILHEGLHLGAVLALKKLVVNG